MEPKTAVNIGIAIAIFVFGGIFFTMAQRGEVLTGLLGGGLIGVVSGMMGLGVISSFIKKEDPKFQKVETKPIRETTDQLKNYSAEKKIGYFKFPTISEDQIHPAHFGYWSVRWSDNLASNSLKELSSGGLEGCSRYMGTYLIKLQLLALYAASYWAYVIHILEVPSECIDQMKVGLNDSIKEYSDPNGEEITEPFIEIFNSFFKHSLKAIGDDLNETPEQAVLSLDINQIAKSFIEAVEFYHFRDGLSMPELEKLYIGHIVADIPVSLLQTLKAQDLVYID